MDNWRLTRIAKRCIMQYVNKSAKAFRLSDRAVSLIDRLADELGISKTAVIELAVRQFSATVLPPPATAPAQPDAAAGAGAGTEGE